MLKFPILGLASHSEYDLGNPGSATVFVGTVLIMFTKNQCVFTETVFYDLLTLFMF